MYFGARVKSTNETTACSNCAILLQGKSPICNPDSLPSVSVVQALWNCPFQTSTLPIWFPMLDFFKHEAICDSRHASAPLLLTSPGFPAEPLTLKPAARPPARTPASAEAAAPGWPAPSCTWSSRRDPRVRCPGSRRQTVEGPAACGNRRTAAAGHAAGKLAAPRWPGPRPHHNKPRLAGLWGTQAVTERVPGGARPRRSAHPGPARRSSGARARPNKLTFVPPRPVPRPPPPPSSEWTHPHTGYAGAAGHVAGRKGGAGRKPIRALWVRGFFFLFFFPSFPRRRPGFRRVSPRSHQAPGVQCFQKCRQVLTFRATFLLHAVRSGRMPAWRRSTSPFHFRICYLQPSGRKLRRRRRPSLRLVTRDGGP